MGTHTAGVLTADGVKHVEVLTDEVQHQACQLCLHAPIRHNPPETAQLDKDKLPQQCSRSDTFQKLQGSTPIARPDVAAAAVQALPQPKSTAACEPTPISCSATSEIAQVV